MPTFDGGHYFLTALIPIWTETEGISPVSPVQALREVLLRLPTAAQSYATRASQSPFARNSRTHFFRLSIIDDVAYNGREPVDAVYAQLRKLNPTIAQPQDHLATPFLYVSAEFDAASGAVSDRDSYLITLWGTMEKELNEIFSFGYKFNERVHDATSFAQYIASCELETTLPFNDYYADLETTLKALPSWPVDKYRYLVPLVIGVLFLGLAFFANWTVSPQAGLILFLLALGTIAAVALAAYSSIMTAGAKPFPTAPDGNLLSILKALYVQKVFTRFAIDNQALAVDQQAAGALHAAFGNFLAQHQPSSLDSPTQPPGVVGL